MRSFAIAAALAAVLIASPQAKAQNAAIMSLNSIGLGELSHDNCMKRAKETVAEAGFEYFDTTTEAVWGRTYSHRDMVSVYCPKNGNIAVFAAGSPTGKGSVTAPLVDRLVEAWQNQK
jgi:hypothetical protein